MNSASEIAEEVVKWVGNRTMLNAEARTQLHRLIVSKVLPLTPVQPQLNFENDKDALAGQSAAILALLKERRSAGAMNHELAEISLKYTSRISDLRAEGFKIICTRREGRTFHYALAPTDW